MVRKRTKVSQRISITKFPFTPETYPGPRPRFSFFFNSKGIYRSQLRTVNKLLVDRGLTPLGERYAILAYGSNACPGQLLRKYKTTGLNHVPVLFGRLVGAEAVYAHRQTMEDHYVPATLARKAGGRPTWITMLTADQIKQMDESEGRPGSYELAELPDVEFFVGGSKFAPLYTYVNIRHGVMIRDGNPVTLRSVKQKRAIALLDLTTEQEAADWLTYDVIGDSDPPDHFSRILKTL